jgi:hypothetical protein
MKFKPNKILALCLALFSLGCTNSKVGQRTGAGGSVSIYANPDSIQFSKEHRRYMLNNTYLQLAYTYPPQSVLDAVSGAADDDEAKEIYDDAIDTLLDSGEIKERLIDYAMNILGVGNKYSGTEAQRYPANLFAYVFLTNKKIDEFLLATYAVNDAGSVVTQTYSGGPPTSAQAGYITMEEYIKKYADTRFFFKPIREILAINLIAKAPFNNIKLYQWDADQMNPKYVSQENSTTVCLACHSYLNPLRGAFHNYNGAFNLYDAGTVQGTNQYGQEDSVGNPREPRANNVPLSPAQGEALYKLMDNGSPIGTPRDFAEELIKHEKFSYAWTVRLLTIMLNIDEGTPGAGTVVPDPFSANDAQQSFAEEWTAKFQDVDRKPKEFFRAFLKSNAYLVTGYNPDDLTGAE